MPVAVMHEPLAGRLDGDALRRGQRRRVRAHDGRGLAGDGVGDGSAVELHELIAGHLS